MASVPTNFPTAKTAPAWSLEAFQWNLSLSQVLKAAGSLKMTVGLFAVSIVLVLVGTLAQDELNMQEVKERYFLSWIAPLHVDDFFPQAFYRHTEPFRLVIPFPGGALVGVLLFVNLIAAKITRFKLQASGKKLAAGLAFLAAGMGVAAAIIFLGHNDDGLQGTPPMSYAQLWAGILAIVAIGSIGTAMASSSAATSGMRVTGYVIAALMGVSVIVMLVTGFQLSDSGLRIVWQLAKGLGAGLIMLVGCQLAFGKRGGNVLLHLGVGLLMIGQFAFGDRQLEQRLSLVEGESTNTFVNLDEVELQVIQTQDGIEDVIAIPAQRLLASQQNEATISGEDLPFQVRVLEYFENSDLTDPPESNLADSGVGMTVGAVAKEKSGGADMAMNLPSAYVELLDDQGEPIGRYLVSQAINDREMLMPDGKSKDILDTIEVADRTYEIGLRLHREVKPYWVQLEDVRRVNYSGTDTPRDYSSFIRIVDQETGEDRKERVWMNNPLRYRGETFYQSNYTSLPGGKELTGIQVVRNSGWLIPYVACSITGLGMLVHFWGTLTRFINRRRREVARESFGEFDAPVQSFAAGSGKQPEPAKLGSGVSAEPTALAAGKVGKTPRTSPEASAFRSEFENDTQSVDRPQGSKRNWAVTAWVGTLAASVALLLLPTSALKNTIKPIDRDLTFNFHDAGTIPVQFGGRVMPLDAYARQTLKAMTNKESLPLDGAPGDIKDRVDSRKLSAVQWLFEVASDEPKLRYLPMFRIDSEPIRAELDLNRRESKLYSLDDLGRNLDRFTRLVSEARAKDSIDQDFKDKKLIELDMRTRQYTMAASAFRLPVPDELPADLFPEGTSEQTIQLFSLRRLERQMDSLRTMPAPAIVPPTDTVDDEIATPDWAAFAPAFFDMARTSSIEALGPPGVRTFAEMLQAYASEDTVAFNEAVDEHLTSVQAVGVRGYDTTAVALERWLGGSAPTTVASMLYILAIIMGLAGLAMNAPRLNAATWATVAIAFIVHTIVIGARVYITGRAPVINLYSSAVFIG
ncbi:MAG: cytochrome c biogenesis protein ResB, partial [Planctomycetota bacterium]